MAGLSQVTLNGIALDIDPDRYDLLDGRRRGSTHKLLEGGTSFQDRGIDVTDIIIRFSGQLIDKATLTALYTLYRQIATEFTFTDFKDNVFTCKFVTGTNSLKASTIKGSSVGYDYEILLNVTSVQKWFGVEDGFPSAGEGTPVTPLPSQAIGDLIYASSATTLSLLHIGDENEILTVQGGLPVWSSPGSGSDPTKLPLAGGTMTGVITFHSSQTFDATRLRITSQTGQDILVANGPAGWSRLGKGADNQVLTVVSGNLAWADPSGGDSLPLSGGTMTGVITFDGSQTFPGTANASHTHAQSDITNLTSDLAGKSNVGHSHSISDVSGLQTALDGKLALAGGTMTGVITFDGSQTFPGTANASHTHAQSDITNLTSDLAAKLALAGGTMTGDITFHTTQTFDATRIRIGSQAGGDLLYATGSTSWARLGASSDGYVLTMDSGLPVWAAATADDITKLPLAGGTMTGVITFDSTQSFDGAKLTFSGQANGDIIYRNGSGAWTTLPVGTNGHVLTLDSGLPVWAAPTGGGGGGGDMEIGGDVTGGTAGSILFIGSGPVLAQDNATLFWNTSNKRLGIGTSSPGFPLHVVKSDSTSGFRVEGVGDNTVYQAFTILNADLPEDGETGQQVLFDLMLQRNEGGTPNPGVAARIFAGKFDDFYGADAGAANTARSAYLGFSTANGGNTTEKMRVTHNGQVLIGHASPNLGSLSIQRNGLGATPHITLELVNSTSAGAGAQQWSPGIVWEGQGWKSQATAASQRVQFRAHVVPIQGVSAPSGILRFGAAINAGAFTDTIGITSGGRIIFGDNLTTSPQLDIVGSGLDLPIGSFFRATNFIAGSQTSVPSGLSGGIYLSSAGGAPSSDPSSNTMAIWHTSLGLSYRSGVTNEGAGRVHYLHNRALSITGAGTNYSLTTSLAAIDFGTTDPALSVPSSGASWLVVGSVAFVGGANVGDIYEVQVYNVTTTSAIGVTRSFMQTVANQEFSIDVSEIAAATSGNSITIRVRNVTNATGEVVSTKTNLHIVRLS